MRRLVLALTGSVNLWMVPRYNQTRRQEEGEKGVRVWTPPTEWIEVHWGDVGSDGKNGKSRRGRSNG